MKLCDPEYYNTSCGVTVISILTGERFSTIKRKIIKIRSKFPRDYYGARCPKSKMLKSTDETFISEIKRCLAGKVKLGKFKPFNKKLKRFFTEYPSGVFLLNFKRHVAIAKDGLIHGNHGSCVEELFPWRNDTIESFAKLEKK